jgi:hypothetical protein
MSEFKKAKSAEELEAERLQKEKEGGAPGEKPEPKKAHDEYDEKKPIGDLIERKGWKRRDKSLATRKHLAGQELVRILIPKTSDEKGEVNKDFNVNGFAFFVKKGSYQKVPLDVANLIEASEGQGDRVLSQHELNLNNNERAQREFSR